MVSRLPGPVVILDGRDCAALNRHLGQLVVALRQRDGAVSTDLVEVVEEVRLAALQFRDIQFRMNPQVNPGSGTVRDRSGSASRSSGSSERLSVTDAARLTGVSKEMIRRLAVRGVLNGTRTGRRGAWEIQPDSVAMWQQCRRERPKAA